MRHIFKKIRKKKWRMYIPIKTKKNPKGNKLSLKYQQLQNLKPLTFSIFLNHFVKPIDPGHACSLLAPLHLPHQKYHGRDLRSSLSFELGSSIQEPDKQGLFERNLCYLPTLEDICTERQDTIVKTLRVRP